MEKYSLHISEKERRKESAHNKRFSKVKEVGATVLSQSRLLSKRCYYPISGEHGLLFLFFTVL